MEHMMSTGSKEVLGSYEHSGDRLRGSGSVRPAMEPPAPVGPPAPVPMQEPDTPLPALLSGLPCRNASSLAGMPAPGSVPGQTQSPRTASPLRKGPLEETPLKKIAPVGGPSSPSPEQQPGMDDKKDVLPSQTKQEESMPAWATLMQEQMEAAKKAFEAERKIRQNEKAIERSMERSKRLVGDSSEVGSKSGTSDPAENASGKEPEKAKSSEAGDPEPKASPTKKGGKSPAISPTALRTIAPKLKAKKKAAKADQDVPILAKTFKEAKNIVEDRRGFITPNSSM